MKKLLLSVLALGFGLTITSAQSVTSGCNYWIPRDGTWSIVPFTIGTTPDYRNDDGSSPLIVLPFNFCLYGSSLDSLYINNNGNISFNGPYSIYSAVGFPDPNYAMVAPFWADVDTRGPLSGLVYYKVNPTNMIVQWDDVGYFASHTDKLNSFQLIISNGSDPIIQQGKNVSFYYRDMQWTTGDASLGVNGFGGTPATVGVNRGNGVDYIQIGKFDHAGTGYDGPFGAADGVDFLDYTYFAIDACFSNANVPPIASSPNACDTVYVCAGDTLLLSASFLSPEPNQLTDPTFNGHGIGGATILSSTTGNIADISVQIITQLASPGFYPVSLVGIDNGSPMDTTFVNVVINVLPSATASFTMPSAACAGDTLTLTYTGTAFGATTYAWDFGSANVLSGSASGPYSLQWNSGITDTVELVVNGQNGCGDSATAVIQVDPLPTVFFSAPPPQCLVGNNFQFIAGGNLIAGTQYSWTFGNNSAPFSSNLQNPDSVSYSSPGNHVITLNGAYNNCAAVPHTDSVEVYISPLTVFSSAVNSGCAPLQVPFTNFSTGESNSYLWNFYDGTNDTDPSPVHEFENPGVYSVTLTATTIHGCTATITASNMVTADPSPTASFTPDPSEVPIYSPIVNFENHSSGGSQYAWDFGDGSRSVEFRPVHIYSDTGTFKVTLIVSNSYGCIDTVIGYARVEPEFTFYVPGAFTPNGDGKNDFFIPFSTSVLPENYHLRIYNRWGNEIFSSDNIQIGWDGRNRNGNTLVPEGTYVYQMEYTDNQHAVHKLTGKVSVIR